MEHQADRAHLNASVYKACVLINLLHDSKSWTLHSQQEKRLNSLHMHCLGRILGISCKDMITNTQVSEQAGPRACTPSSGNCAFGSLGTSAEWMTGRSPRTSCVASSFQASDQLDGLSYASKMCASVTSGPLTSTQAPGRRLQKTAPVGNIDYTQVSTEERRRRNRWQRRSESAGSNAKEQTQRHPIYKMQQMQ